MFRYSSVNVGSLTAVAIGHVRTGIDQSHTPVRRPNAATHADGPLPLLFCSVRYRCLYRRPDALAIWRPGSSLGELVMIIDEETPLLPKALEAQAENEAPTPEEDNRLQLPPPPPYTYSSI
jgi:hypothetical protein